jgi:hypothetical protein
MNEIAWVLTAVGLALSMAAAMAVRARRRPIERIAYLRPPGVLRVVTKVDGPNRNLAATLPQRNRALADADRHFFGYERVRAPRYRPELAKERADVLRPVQVIRVGSRDERDEIASQIPPHLKVIFLEGDAAVPSAAEPPPSQR